MVAALCVTEISSPFLHMREILKELGYKDTDLNLAADVSFSYSYLFPFQFKEKNKISLLINYILNDN